VDRRIPEALGTSRERPLESFFALARSSLSTDAEARRQVNPAVLSECEGRQAPGTFETCADDVSRSACGTRAVLSRISLEGRVLPEPNFYVDRILRTPLSSVPPCQFGSLAVLEHGRTIPFSDIGLSTGAFVFVLGSPQIRCRQHSRRLSPEPRDDALAVATERRPPDVILMRLGKDAPLGRQIERSVAIVITPILSGLHHCYARI
jgi:hypothetical protein